MRRNLRIICYFLKKTLNASRPVMTKNVKTFRWDRRLHIQNLFMAFETSSPMVVTLGQQYNVGEKPTVILYTYTYINRHAGTPDNN